MNPEEQALVSLNTNVFQLPSEHQREQAFMNQMTQLWNRRDSNKDFVLVNKDNPEMKFKVDLFVLVARSEFFRNLASSSMLEAQ